MIHHQRKAKVQMQGVQALRQPYRLTITSWIKKAKSRPSLSEKLLPAQSGDVLELDELWSFVQKKANKS